jgi:uncharacterized membrane protein YraQ (UPF0718 family)
MVIVGRHNGLMELLESILFSVWHVVQEMGVWLLLGLVAAGLIKAWMPPSLMTRWMGGEGMGAATRAAFFGAPLPLCSCGVLPAAVSLKRAGASRQATTSFLISTPETGVDSIAVSWALLGPLMTIMRPIAAITTAIVTGTAVGLVEDQSAVESKDESSSCCANKEQSADEESQKAAGLAAGLRFAFSELLSDLAGWLVIGIVASAIMLVLLPPESLATFGSSWITMLLMLVVGIPMYICATASTPIAAALLIAGVSPGAVLVFMLAGPATNIAGLAVVSRELGRNVLPIYLGGIAGFALFFGILTDWLVDSLSIDIAGQLGHGHVLPELLSAGSGVVLLGLLGWTFAKKFLPSRATHQPH